MPDRSPSARRICRMGALTLDAGDVVLLRDGTPLPVGRRAVALLLRLIETPGEIVGKAALYEAAWAGQAVEESNLTVQMSLLRRVLAAEAQGRGWIETLPRRGYRFTGPVEWLGDAGGGAPAAVSNVPLSMPLHFTGRAEALEELHAALHATQHGRIAPGPAVVALHGMRGVGKTILAAAYARRHEATYRATWWLRAETAPTLRGDLAALAVRLGWVRPDAAEDTAAGAALERLRDDGAGVLLIYDNAGNAASVRPYLPRGGGAHVIITSNAPAWRAHATPLALEVWAAPVGADYLMARTGRAGPRAAAEELSAALGGLPLAHEQAAAYIEQLEIPFADYLGRLAAAPIRLLGDPAHAPPDYHGGLTVAKAFALAIDQAVRVDPACLTLLHAAALLPAEPIPVFVFREGLPALAQGGLWERERGEDALDAALATLRSFALIGRAAIADERDPALRTDCVLLHRLVREAVRAAMPEAAAARGRAAVIAALARVYPARVFNTRADWPRARRLEALAQPLVAPPAAIPAGAAAAASALLDGLASFRHVLADFGAAAVLFERALSLTETVHGPVHALTAQRLNNLALLMRDRGDLAAALPLHARALGIRENALGPHHPDTAVSLNNLANVLAAQGDDPRARPLLERALAIWTAAHGEEHPQTARSMNNLANLLHRLGDLAAARALHERALTIRQRCLGGDDPDTANSLHNLARLLLDLGSAEAAQDMASRAAGITAAALGEDHPDTAGIRVSLARIMLARGDAAGSLALAQQALAALRAALAEGAPAIRGAAEAAASALEALGQGGGAFGKNSAKL